MTDNILQITAIEQLINEIKEIDFVRIREYLNQNKNTLNICYIDKLSKVLLRQSQLEFKQAYMTLSIRGDGNCFYRSIMLLFIFELASQEDSNELHKFILMVRDLKNIRSEYTSIILKSQDLQKIFLIFLMKIYSWKVQQLQFNIQTILNEYNSLPEVDVAANTVCRFLIYSTFMGMQNHPSIASFIDDEMKQRIPKILLKQNEYAEDIIIPIAAQSNNSFTNNNLKYFQLIVSLSQNQLERFNKFILDKILTNISQQILNKFSVNVLDSQNSFIFIYQIKTFFCQLVVQNSYQDQGNNSKINTEKLVYQPQITLKGNNQIQLKQIHILFTKDHYDCLIPSEITSKNQNFYNIQSTTFSPNFQNINTFNNFLFHQKFKIQQNQKSQNQLSQSQVSSSNFDDFGLTFEPKKNNSQNQNLPQQNQQDDNNHFIDFQNFGNNNNTQMINIKPQIQSSRTSLQLQQQVPQFNQLKTNDQNTIINQYSYPLKPQRESSVPQQNEIDTKIDSQNNQDKYQAIDQIKKNTHRRNNSIQQFTQKVNNAPVQFQPNQNQFQRSESIKQNPFQQSTITDNNNLNKQNNQINDIPLINSAFMIDQVQQFENNIKPSALSSHKNPIKISLSNNQTQNFKKTQVVPILKFEEDDNEEDDNLVVDENEDMNPIRKDSNQKPTIMVGKNVCIQCKQPFKSSKFIVKGKQLALLCLDCLEQIMEHVAKDEKTVIIDNLTYKFGDAILSKIKEKFIIDKELKKDNIAPILHQKSASVQYQPPVQIQKPQLSSKSDIKSYSSSNNQVMKPNTGSSVRQFICGQCNKQCSTSYEVTLIKNKKDEEKQRVCIECIPVFVLYYENPSEIIKFGGNTYKIDKIFGKYLYYQQCYQAQQQVIDETKQQRRSVNSQYTIIKDCLICKSNTKKLLYMTAAENSNVKQSICKSCFYMNVNCVNKQTFTFENKMFYIDDEMSSYAKDLIFAQVYEYHISDCRNSLD